MRQLMTFVLLAIISLGCRDIRPKAQDWVTSAPEKTAVGVSCHLGWILEMPDFRNFIARYPLYDNALELFLDSAKIDPASETAKLSVYMLKLPNPDISAPSIKDWREMLLMQIAGFREPKAIQRVIMETFSPEGSLRLRGREYPLFVVLDINDVKIRIVSDNDGRVWIGDIAALQETAKKRSVGDSGYVSRASEWITSSSAIQGFVQPELIPKDVFQGFANSLPAGIKGLAWSASPSQRDKQIINLDLAITGTDEAVNKIKPWMQRIFAMASSLADGDGTGQPETVQESNRMGVRCQFKQSQLSQVLDSLNLKDLVPISSETSFTKSDKAR
ncbi:MAG: hypothetical protein LBB40_01515 [Holophagales bacterium]|jgi:hypothetical protein|nr:hypothetical protein [Holophagales bacterium]